MGDALAILFGVLAGLAGLVLAIVMPIVALVSARAAQRRVKTIDEVSQTQAGILGQLRGEIGALRLEVGGLRARLAEAERHAQSPAAAPPVESAPPQPEVAPVSPIEPRASAIVVEDRTQPDEARTLDENTPLPAPLPASTDPLAASPSPPPQPQPQLQPESVPLSTATPPPPPPPAAAPQKATLEERIALVWFTRIGAIALLLGVAYFYKYAVDNDWIGPLGRVALGVIAGAGVLAVAEIIRARSSAIFVNVLVGVGLALLYISAYASHGLYHLTSVPVAFACVAAVTLLGGALAIHHKGEPILIFALVTGFLSPALLSTGEDRPLALFGYLLVLTTLAQVVALRMSFRWASWTGVAGAVLVFLGWYGKFFDTHAPYADGELVNVGAYRALGPRIVPLVAVLLFSAQWLWLYLEIGRRKLEDFLPLVVLLVALGLAHTGLGLLLFDRPLLLGAGLTALGVLSIFLLTRAGRRELLGIPMGVSLCCLLATAASLPRANLLGELSVLGVWAAIYAVTFLGDLRKRRPSSAALALTGGVGCGFALLAGIVLLDRAPLAYVLVLVALSLAYATLAAVVEVPIMGLLACVLSFAGLAVAAPWSNGKEDFRFLLAAGAWAAVYLGAEAWSLRKRRPPTALRLLCVTLAGLGFLLVAEVQTLDGNRFARAVLLAIVGAVDLALGAATLRSGERRRASPLLGQAIGLFAASVAFLFSGATLTIVWAVMSAVVAWLAADADAPVTESATAASAEQARGDGLWLLAALALFGLTVVRVLGWDLGAPGRARDLFFSTDGRQGQLAPLLFVNARTYALAATGGAFLIAARSVGRRARPFFTWSAATLLTIGHALLVLLFALEVRDLAHALPAAPVGLDHDAFALFQSHYEELAQMHTDRVAMVTTLVLAVYATGLVAIGFGFRNRAHRFLGLGLFALTLAKLVLWDVWNLAHIYQMMVLVGVGALLLGASYLYARLGRRLVALLRDGEATKVATAIAILGSLALAGRARAFDPAELASRRSVQGVNAPGLYRAAVDVDLYRSSTAESPLTDLRIAGPDGKELAFLVRDVPIVTPAIEHSVTLVDPAHLPDGATRVVLDLGAPGKKHSRVHLDISGGGYLRHTRVEGSMDEVAWQPLIEGPYVFRVSAGGDTASRSDVDYPLSDMRYLRVTLLPGADGQRLEVSGANVVYATAASRIPVGTFPLDRDHTTHPPINGGPMGLPPKTSEFVWDLGAAGVPIRDVILDVATPAFERSATVMSTGNPPYWATVGRGALWRAEGSTPLGPAESLVLDAGGARKRWLRVLVNDGDDPPLAVRGAIAEYRAQEIVFRAEAAGPHTLYVGAASLPQPSYDLPAVLARSGEVVLLPATLGATTPNPRFGQHEEPPAPLTDRHPLAVGALLALVVLGLALYAVRLMRKKD